jgi:hypothetical protein
VWVKVSRRSLPVVADGLRLFVADNKNVKNITDDKQVHGLLLKDALICISAAEKEMLDPNSYVFPVSFNDGFTWNAQEDSYMFSYMGKTSVDSGNYYRSYEGIGLDLNDARGLEKHWVVAMEKSTVVWVEDKNLDENDKRACVLLNSEANPDIYYVYDYLYTKNLEVKKGQKLMRGELIGTVWGDKFWGHLQLAVIKSDTVPVYGQHLFHSVNFFPQLYELYFKQSYSLAKSYQRGKIEFGRATVYCGNQKNTAAYEAYSGKGWVLGQWNISDKVDVVERGEEGNVRLKKVLFSDSAAKSRNPENYYDYEVNVKNGVYRLRAKVGDVYLPSSQKIEFEGIAVGNYSLEAGEQKWTAERVVKVTDYKLTVRIHIDKGNQKVAGLSEIVFQQAY